MISLYQFLFSLLIALICFMMIERAPYRLGFLMGVRHERRNAKNRKVVRPAYENCLTRSIFECIEGCERKDGREPLEVINSGDRGPYVTCRADENAGLGSSLLDARDIARAKSKCVVLLKGKLVIGVPVGATNWGLAESWTKAFEASIFREQSAFCDLPESMGRKGYVEMPPDNRPWTGTKEVIEGGNAQ